MTEKNQHGDPRFLEQVQKCIAQRRALLGLDAPTLVAPVRPDGTPLGLTSEVLHVVHEVKLQLLEDRSYFDYLRDAAADESDALPAHWADDGRYLDGFVEAGGKDVYLERARGQLS